MAGQVGDREQHIAQFIGQAFGGRARGDFVADFADFLLDLSQNRL